MEHAMVLRQHVPSLLQVNKEHAGVILGCGRGGISKLTDGVKSTIEMREETVPPFSIPYASTNTASALLAIDLGFMGPTYSISTACATSNFCFCAAANHIRRGDADIMVAGGTEAGIQPVGLGAFIACKALSSRNDSPETASRPWDKGREGFVMGEGAGALVSDACAIIQVSIQIRFTIKFSIPHTLRC